MQKKGNDQPIFAGNDCGQDSQPLKKKSKLIKIFHGSRVKY